MLAAWGPVASSLRRPVWHLCHDVGFPMTGGLHASANKIFTNHEIDKIVSRRLTRIAWSGHHRLVPACGTAHLTRPMTFSLLHLSLSWQLTWILLPVQVIIGSYPHGDGTFDKANDFQSVVVDGAWNMGLGTAKLHAGQVAYIVPAAKGEPFISPILWLCICLVQDLQSQSMWPNLLCWQPGGAAASQLRNIRTDKRGGPVLTHCMPYAPEWRNATSAGKSQCDQALMHDLHALLLLTLAPHAGNSYPALDGSTNRPGFCYDTALLLPEFNPMAVPLPGQDAQGISGLVASPLTTVLVFSQASGALLRSHPHSLPSLMVPALWQRLGDRRAQARHALP